MARTVIEKDLSEGTYTESDPYVAPLGGDFRNFNVRSLSGDVRFRDEYSSAWATLREGESWDCFDPPVDELRFAGSGSFEIVADTSVQISPSGGGGDQNERDLLAAWAQSSRSDTGISGLLGRAASHSFNTQGTGAAVSAGILNGLTGVHLVLPANGTDHLSIRGEPLGGYVPFPSLFNGHGFDLPDAPDWMIFVEDDICVSSFTHGAEYAAAFFGIGYLELNLTTGATAHSFIGFQAHTSLISGGDIPWRVFIGDTDAGWNVVDVLSSEYPANRVRRLRVGIGMIGGVPTIRLYIDDDLVKEYTDADLGGDFTLDTGVAGPTHSVWRHPGDSTGEITLSGWLGEGLTLYREEGQL